MYGDAAITVWSVRLSLAAWFIACWLMLNRHDGARIDRAARWAWTAGFALLVAHIVAAYAINHQWSHAEAVRFASQQVVDHPWFGFEMNSALYYNYAFAAVWLGDLIWWWAWPVSRARRPVLLTVAMHTILVFFIAAATLLFAPPTTRWISLACLILLLILSVRRAAGAPLR